MNRLQSVDLVRVAAIVAVIAIHTEPFASPSVPVGERLDAATLINQAARFAVPFFFILSGYFWARKIASSAGVIAATLPVIRRIAFLFLFLFWSMIYLVPIDWSSWFGHGMFGPLKQVYWSLGSALQQPVTTLFEGTMYHLWFLPALICSLAISALLLQFRQTGLLVLLAIVLFLTGLAGGAYRATPFGFPAQFNFRDGPFFSLVFFVSGYLLYHRQVRTSWLPIGVALACLGACLQCYEVSMLNRLWGAPMTQDYVFATYFVGLGIAMIAISNPRLLQSAWAPAIGHLVLGIYASHIIFVKLLSPLNHTFQGSWLWSILYVTLVFLLSYLLAHSLKRFNLTKKLVM